MTTQICLPPPRRTPSPPNAHPPPPTRLAARRIHAKFGLSKDENITFNDILQSPAAGEMSSLVHHEQRLDDVDDTAVLIPTERYLAAQVRRGAYDV